MKTSNIFQLALSIALGMSLNYANAADPTDTPFPAQVAMTVPVLKPASGQTFTKSGELPQINFDFHGTAEHPCLEHVSTVSSELGSGTPGGPGSSPNTIGFLEVNMTGSCPDDDIINQIDSYQWPDGSPMYSTGSAM